MKDYIMTYVELSPYSNSSPLQQANKKKIQPKHLHIRAFKKKKKCNHTKLELHQNASTVSADAFS